MARYRKIDPRVWNDEKFRTLSESEKLISFYAITAQSNRIGIFKFSTALAAEDLNLDFETFRERFGNVCQTLFWAYDSTLRVLYIPTWWKYNHPENGNVLKGCLNDIDELPQTYLLEQFTTNKRYLDETLHQTFTQTLAKRYPKPYPIQEQEQEQEQKQKQEQDEATFFDQAKALGIEFLNQFKGRKPDKIETLDEFQEKVRINPKNLSIIKEKLNDPKRDRTQKPWQFWVFCGLDAKIPTSKNGKHEKPAVYDMTPEQIEAMR